MIGRVASLLAVAIVLAACGERQQSADADRKKVDAAAWTASDSATPGFSAPGWKAGDKLAWEEQLRKRSQAQNDYVR